MADPYSPSKKKKRRDRRGTGAKADLSGGDLEVDGGALLPDQGDEDRLKFLRAMFDHLFPTLKAERETVAKAEAQGIPWEYFTLDEAGPVYLDEGFPPEAMIGTAEGYAITAVDSEGVAHAHAQDGDRNEILRGAARMAASEGCFTAVGRAMGVLGRDTVFREIATFKPVSKDEVEIEIDEDAPAVHEHRVPVLKTDVDRQIVYGEVYAPVPFPDAHGDVMSAPEIEKMAHQFLSSGRVNKIDTKHDNVENGARVVESFIADEGSEYIPGAWVVGVHVPNPDLWLRIKSGELNGFSMQTLVHEKQKTIVLDIPENVEGQTEEAENDDSSGRHRHNYVVTFDDAGNFAGGSTSVSHGHGHDISRMSITEYTRGRGGGEVRHRHRYSFLAKLFGGQPLDEATGREAEAA